MHVRIHRGSEWTTLPLKNHCNAGPDPLKNHKDTNPAFNVRPSSACQRNAISMAFRWRADDGPLIVVSGFFLPSPTNKKKKKKNVVEVGTPFDKKFWIRACHACMNNYMGSQVICLGKSFATSVAFKWFLSSMNNKVQF